MVVMDWVVFLREVWASVSLLLIFDRDLRNSIRSRKDEWMSQKLLLLLKKVVYRFRRIVSLVEKFKNESIVLRSIHSDISFDNNRGINGGRKKYTSSRYDEVNYSFEYFIFFNCRNSEFDTMRSRVCVYVYVYVCMCVCVFSFNLSSKMSYVKSFEWRRLPLNYSLVWCIFNSGNISL